MLVTSKEFSELLGVRPSAISNSKKRGRIRPLPDGRFDLDDALNKAYLSDRSQQRSVGSKVQDRNESKEGSQTPPPTPASEPRTGPSPKSSSPVEMDLRDQLDAQRIEKLKIENATKLGRLVPREDVRSVFMRFYTVHTSILPAIPATAGGTICDELGIMDAPRRTRVAEILDVAIYDALEEMKSVMTRQLKNLEAEK